MKKELLVGLMLLLPGIGALHAQSSTEQSIRPADGLVYSFQSEDEKNKVIPLKIAELNKAIDENSEYPNRVKSFRETIWRYENAVIAEVSGAHYVEPKSK